MDLLIQDVPTLVFVVVAVPAVLAIYIVGTEYLVRLLPDKQRPRVRPWFWVGPALLFVTAFLVLPALGTVVTSFQDHDGNFIGLLNYQRQLGDFPTGGAWIAIRNNVYWLILYTLFVLFFGLILAVLFDRVRYESIVKSFIFMLMMPTVVVVGTTLVIFALKAFDVVYVMTAGNFQTDVLANRMYKLLYQSDNPGGASAVAIILLIAVVPVLIFNLRQFRAVEARR